MPQVVHMMIPGVDKTDSTEPRVPFVAELRMYQVQVEEGNRGEGKHCSEVASWDDEESGVEWDDDEEAGVWKVAVGGGELRFEWRSPSEGDENGRGLDLVVLGVGSPVQPWHIVLRVVDHPHEGVKGCKVSEDN